MASELAAAFLTLAPKLEGGFGSKVKGQLESEIDGKSLGDKVGGSFGKGLSGGTKKAFTAGTVALGNIMSNVAMKAANFAGDAFADAFENVMNYEQLQGGVEKIFDQADTSRIFADAQDAYKTLNMSANEYLEAINQVGASFAQTMGDQKGYDTAKAGMQAIADYASGTGRNINELNDKFSMITRATSSYQSIADQFSGILPATSADFLEQAQAAGILSDSYTKLTEVPVAEYQEAVSLMLEKGVEDMGLAGNTAAESAETISGSIAMLKSSWDNFLTALGDESGTIDIDKAIQDLKDSLKAVADNVLPLIQRIGDTILQELPTAIEAALELVVSTADEWVPQFMDFGGRIGLAIVSGLANGLTPFMDELNAGVEDGLNAVGEGISDFASGVGDAMSELLSGAQHDLGAMGDAFGQARDAIGTALSGAVTNVTTGARGIMDGISRGITSIPGRVKGVFERVKSAISEPIDKAKTLVSGAIDHIKGLFPLSIGKIFSNIQLPHIHVDGGSPPFGIGGKGSLPSFSVEWYAKGGIADGATLIGVGEAGPEAIIPLQGQFMRPFAHAIAEELGGGGITINLNYDASDDANDMLRDITSGIRQLRAAGAI